jgi:hypothetical protein
MSYLYTSSFLGIKSVLATETLISIKVIPFCTEGDVQYTAFTKGDLLGSTSQALTIFETGV